MFAKKGFTLVEILFVLIIAAGIMAYAVPSYKRAKERSRYEAATGILLDVGSAAAQIKRSGEGCTGKNAYLQVPVNYTASATFTQAMAGQTWRDYKSTIPVANYDARCKDSLFGLGYLQKIPANTGYEYYIVNNPSGLTICSSKCTKLGTVACMCQTDAEEEKGSGCFYGALLLKDGSIEQLRLDTCEQ